MPGKTPVQLGKKLIFDQVIFTPPLIAAFFTINECKRKKLTLENKILITSVLYYVLVLSGRNLLSAKNKVEADLWSTVKANWSVWGPGTG